jgi:hypothetical protein
VKEHHQYHGNGPKAVNIRPVFGWCGRQDQPIHDCATNGISAAKFTGLASRIASPAKMSTAAVPSLAVLQQSAIFGLWRGVIEAKNPDFRAPRFWPANRAFAGRPNRLPNALKNTRKTLPIQQLVDRDFALGASPLSWHK